MLRNDAAIDKKVLDVSHNPASIMFPLIRYPNRHSISIRGCAHTLVRASSYGIDEQLLLNHLVSFEK